MIVDLPGTTTSQVAKKLVKIREEGGQIALGRVLNLVILGDRDELDAAITAANIASNEHPCRIIAVAAGAEGSQQLDAQIRVGGDAGASEVIVLQGTADQVAHTDTLIMPLLLPDAPIVAWWPGQAPAAPRGNRWERWLKHGSLTRSNHRSRVLTLMRYDAITSPEMWTWPGRGQQFGAA